ncbi:oxidoreductase [Pseudonocardiaceae bacterium YIM PH 21723]|nr:oxidoreductase [Pseudonocardiaceae bacterium YIM PH 21723]
MTSHVVVLGAGYSGLVAAKLIARSGARVTLINDRDRFVERVRLHQLAAGQPLADLPLTELLDGSGVQLHVNRVVRIDAEARRVHCVDGSTRDYDTLVYALGSSADLDSVPGVREHAYTVAGQEDADKLRARIAEGGSVTVVGGGLTGLEAVTEFAETHPRLTVRLVTAEPLGAALSAKGAAHVRRVLDRLGVEVRDNAPVAEVRAGGLVLAGGEHLPADVVVWSTGFRLSPLAADAGFTVDRHGRMLVDGSMRSISHPEVYGIGDSAAAQHPNGQELRMSCAAGLPVAQTAARAITARLAGKEPKPLRFRFINQCISLGRDDGLIQFVHADDSPKERVLTGRLAARYKETVVRSTIFLFHHPGMPTSI